MDLGEFITSRVGDMDEEQKSEIAADFAEGVLKLCEDAETTAPERDA